MNSLDKAIRIMDSEDPPLYEYEASVYANFGKKQEYVGKVTHCYEHQDIKRIKKDLTMLANRRRNASNMSIKNIKFIKEW